MWAWIRDSRVGVKVHGIGTNDGPWIRGKVYGPRGSLEYGQRCMAQVSPHSTRIAHKIDKSFHSRGSIAM